MSENAPSLEDFMPAVEPAEAAPADTRPDLLGCDRDDLAAILQPLGLERFRAKQLFSWIYNRGATDFQAMSNLAKRVRQSLTEGYRIGRPGVSGHQRSEDDTQKWLLRFADGHQAETVHIPEPNRGTLCISSQVGCTLTCSFCHTGTQKLVRNLEAGEIAGQVMMARDSFGEWPSPNDDRKLTNIVLMGMGEPLYNFENVKKAVALITDPEGLAISKRRVTLSTSGVVPMMRRCGEEMGVMLAVSLHAVTDELRDELVPINRKWPIAELLQACREYPRSRENSRITFEYVMLKGVNDSVADARALVKLLQGIPAKVNLIPFNPWPGAVYECSSERAIEAFAEIVRNAGTLAMIRRPRGRDILAACGQLKSASLRTRKGKRRRPV